MADRFGLTILVMATLFAAPAKAQESGQASGIWLTQAGDAKVKVGKCNGGICGVIVWLRSDQVTIAFNAVAAEA